MKIHTTITVHIERSDGSSTRVSESSTYDAGDNPLYEAREVQESLVRPTDAVIGRVAGT